MSRFALASLIFVVSLPAFATDPLPDPGMFTCDSVTAVATNAADLAAPAGCTESWNTTTVGNAEFFYELNQAVDLGTLKHGTDILALARKHHITIPSGITSATIDATSTAVSNLKAETTEIALMMPEECGGVDSASEIKIYCVRVRINGTTYAICLECSFSLYGDFRNCMITLTES